MELSLIFTIIFVIITALFFLISYDYFIKRMNITILPPCLNKKVKDSNEPLCHELYIKKLDKFIYILVPILIGLTGASLFCLIYVLI